MKSHDGMSGQEIIFFLVIPASAKRVNLCTFQRIWGRWLTFHLFCVIRSHFDGVDMEHGGHNNPTALTLNHITLVILGWYI